MKLDLFYQRPRFVPWERETKKPESETSTIVADDETLKMGRDSAAGGLEAAGTATLHNGRIPEELSFERVVSGATYPVKPPPRILLGKK